MEHVHKVLEDCLKDARKALAWHRKVYAKYCAEHNDKNSAKDLKPVKPTLDPGQGES